MKRRNAVPPAWAVRSALITGAGLGLGGVTAEAMADEGAHLVLCDIDPAALQHTQSRLETRGAECLALRCDVSDSTAVDAMFAQAVQRFGTVDILVNNAARVPSAPAEEARRNLHQQYMTTPVRRRSLGIVFSLSQTTNGSSGGESTCTACSFARARRCV